MWILGLSQCEHAVSPECRHLFHVLISCPFPAAADLLGRGSIFSFLMNLHTVLLDNLQWCLWIPLPCVCTSI